MAEREINKPFQRKGITGRPNWSQEVKKVSQMDDKEKSIIMELQETF